MLMAGKKWSRYFAILVALVMVVETIAFTMTGYAKDDAHKAYELANEDKATVSEISNMTGVKAEDIIKLRKEGNNWNQILEHIKNNPEYKAQGDSTKRNDVLAKIGVDEDTIKKLKEEGFTEEQIVEAKSLVERVIFQLDEISNMQITTLSAPQTGADADAQKEIDEMAYAELSGKINFSDAVYLVMKLSNELGGLQAAFDEYLYSLQLGIDLKQCLTDKKAYEMQKQQKTAELALKNVITSASIEEKMLDMLQGMNEPDESIPEVKAGTSSIPDIIDESPMPDVQAPAIQDVKPQNPADALMQEIEGIKNNGIEQNGR